MGSVFGGGSKPPPPPPVIEPPAPPPEAPTPVSKGVQNARDDARRRAAAKSGYSGTLLTGDLGTATTSKTILGG